MLVKRASVADLDAVAPLFDAYRQFYGQRPDPAAARAFLDERLSRDESVIFLAVDDGERDETLGFTQLYRRSRPATARASKRVRRRDRREGAHPRN